MLEVATVMVCDWEPSCVWRVMDDGVVVPVILVKMMSLSVFKDGSVNATEEGNVVVAVTFAQLNVEP